MWVLVVCRQYAETSSAQVSLVTLGQLTAAAVKKDWDKEVQAFRSTCQVTICCELCSAQLLADRYVLNSCKMDIAVYRLAFYSAWLHL